LVFKGNCTTAFLGGILKQQILRTLSVVKIIPRKRKLKVLKWQHQDYCFAAKYFGITWTYRPSSLALALQLQLQFAFYGIVNKLAMEVLNPTAKRRCQRMKVVDNLTLHKELFKFGKHCKFLSKLANILFKRFTGFRSELF
jgi:hypothetical protein